MPIFKQIRVDFAFWFGELYKNAVLGQLFSPGRSITGIKSESSRPFH
jgi:hypothetical protein